MKTRSTPKTKTETITDFMLAEYQTSAENRLHEIERGQSYVNLFLTITSGAAALIVLVGQNASPSFYFVSVWILFLLLLLGIVSFIRVIERDIRITRHGRSMNRLRRYFAEIEPNVGRYLSYSTHDDTPKYASKGRDRIGLRSVVSLINNSVGATLAYLITPKLWGANIGIIVATITFVLMLALHELYASMSWRKAEKQSTIRFPSGSTKSPKGRIK